MYTKNNNISSLQGAYKVAFPCSWGSARYVQDARLGVGVLFHGRHTMRNQGQEACAELMESETEYRRWEKRCQEQDARKFEEIVYKSRVRLGLEVSNA